MTEDNESTIRLLGLEEPEPGRAERSGRRREEFRYERSEIPVEVFRRRVEEFLGSVREVVAGLSATAGDYHLDQVQVSVEISAKGQLSLLGTGGELAGKGGMVFTFKRGSAPEA
ncbi:Pepco domain-containing protein [Actinosynnema pretiosum]|uniref:Pepco domain-containing protein n=1 Tax=Actinosynnema pretiosum TaxID=42197 RepID=A0A290Z5F9_9PSEU|nr:hypothetical protein [Actinosynnema pretiosum]ATE54222.1 hypothetical protein CNX65_13745 [Actinosynnema pretiosum]